ncbi:MAG TPA: shikimate dehydrogenase [Gemmatimonadales bacterium]|nr:shikimate dehydrogenase [Gemmatimonadales bacterium]
MRIGSNTRLLAVLGDPIAHSLSPIMHNAALAALGVDAVYVALRISPDEFSDTFHTLGTLGIAGNVTVPHKEAAERDVMRKTDLCARAGACNTYWVEQGALVGDNTDVPAIAAELTELGVTGGRWLVVGTGGSARATTLAAADAHADLSVHSRNAGRAREFADWASALGVNARVAEPPYTADVVVNATPLGLAASDPLPIDPASVRGIRAALDLVYRPGATRWIRELQSTAIPARDGRGVLVRQGALAWERFFPEHPAPVEIMRAAVERALRA